MQQRNDVWDPAQYMRFGNERLRPALDLLAYVTTDEPGAVVDLGCGTGNLTEMMKARWPDADVLGIDSSEKMLATARETHPGCRFEAAEVASWAPQASFDVIYSNATLQWLADHPVLLPRLLSALNPGGCMAIQMPAMHDAPLRRLQVMLAHDPRFASYLAAVPSQPAILTMEQYYALLQPLCTTLDLWETTYLHILEGPHAVMEWASGTSLRPYLNALPPEMRDSFKSAYATALEGYYPREVDGHTLLPFKRLFLVAKI